MTVSSRYAVPLAIVLAIAVVPTLIHSYAAVTHDDGVRIQHLSVRVDGAGGTQTARKPEWVKRRLSSVDWQERRYAIGGREVLLFIGRSYDPKALYHHPELALADELDLTPQGVVDVRGVPAHVLSGGIQNALAMYALHADGGFVADPIRFQIRTATTGLFRGRTPMTLFFALERGASVEGDVSVTAAAKVLEAGIKAFNSAK